jgi:hypothetical protein
MTELARQVYEQGYCVMEGVYSAQECVEMEDVLVDAWRRDERDTMGGVFGSVFHPLLKYAPDMAPFYDRPDVVSVIGEVLQDDVCLAHSGALLADETRQFCGWHVHLNGDQYNRWEPKPDDYGRQVERVLGNVYVHGSNETTGELLVYPRRVTDPWDAPHDELSTEWDDQDVLTCPPGSVVIFDTALWHAARAPSQPCRRFLWGAHYSRMGDPKPHREDNWHDSPEIQAHRAKYETFASLTAEKPAKFR